PEAVAGAGEVVPDGRRVEPRIDPHEEDAQMRGDDVRHRASGGRLELLARGAPRRARDAPAGPDLSSMSHSVQRTSLMRPTRFPSVSLRKASQSSWSGSL